MSEIMNGDEINEIERYIPSGNPDALHRPLRNVVASHRALQAKVRELEERLNEQKQLTEHAEASEEYARAEWTKDLAHLQDLEATLRQVEQERDQARADTQSLRELVGQWIWAMYLTPESYECRTIETYRQAVEARVRQLEEMVQAELPPPLRRLEQQELLRLRARVEELEEVLRASRIGLDDWLNQYASELCDEERVKEAVKRIEYHGGTLAYIASLQDKNKRALEGKEEHGTKSKD